VPGQGWHPRRAGVPGLVATRIDNEIAMQNKRVRVGVDLGGTKIEIVALGPHGAPLLRRRVPTPRDDYRATLEAVVGLIGDAERDLGTTGTVGIGTPGSISRATGLLRGSNSVCLNGQPIKRDLEAALGREVRITNDANCFALSEASDGAGKDAAVVFGAILGTGVGAGIVVHGRVLDGPNAIAGEWGHNPLPWPKDDERPGAACFCGRSACIETFVSGPGIERDHLRATGEPVKSHDIVARAVIGDAACEATLVRFEERLARALAHVINLLDPDVIVLGGGLSNVSRLYANVPRLWGPWVFSDRVDTRLVKHAHGDSSGVRGAAWLGGA
jgi:fructokinase